MITKIIMQNCFWFCFNKNNRQVLYDQKLINLRECIARVLLEANDKY